MHKSVCKPYGSKQTIYIQHASVESAKHNKAYITRWDSVNNDGSYFGMDGSALSPSRGQKHTISQ